MGEYVHAVRKPNRYDTCPRLPTRTNLLITGIGNIAAVTNKIGAAQPVAQEVIK